MQPSPYVSRLDAFGRTDVGQAGGKGANLGELLRAGFPVPPGFVVTTAAYEALLGHAGLAGRIPGLVEAAPDGSSVRAAVAAAGMPAALDGLLRDAYRELGGGPVAVRSSATAEDLPGAAFAGQQDTELGVVGEQAVLDAVRRCWASLWTERAIAYRRRQGVATDEVRIAVVVQRMVPAEFAGVMFTADPVTGARDRIVVDASAGLGETVVGGLVTPDRFVLDRRSRRLREARRGRREVVIRALPGGGTQRETGAPADDGLPRRALGRLAGLGVAIERHFGAPQDVEWAWAGGRAYIVQARPITALPEPSPRPSTLERFKAGMVSELLPVRPYPLDVTTWTGALIGSVLGAFRFGGMAAPPIGQVLVEDDGVMFRFQAPVPHPTPRVLLTPARLLVRAVRYDPRRWEADPLLTRTIEQFRALERRDLETLGWDELLATMRTALRAPDGFDLRLRYLPRAGLALGYIYLVLWATGRKDRISDLLAAGNLKTDEANRALETLAAHIRADPELREIFAAHEPADLAAELAGRPLIARLDDFLARYGHRETVSPLIATQPTWSAAPEVVLGILKGFAAVPPSPVRHPSSARTLRGELLAHPLVRLPGLRGLTVRALDLTTELVRIRDDTRFYLTIPLPVIRRVMLEFGRRLTAAGVLDAAEDVFHLRLEELDRGGPPPPDRRRQDPDRQGAADHWSVLRETARRRREKRAALGDTPVMAPRLPDGDDAGEALLRGTPGSSGVAEGPVRVIRDAHEFGRLQTGEVLVAPYTHPAWTLLFQRAAAVVVDSGGAASHAAIVAREYGIPAVMGTVDGTRRLTDGQIVRVDGSRGTVTPPTPDPAGAARVEPVP